LCNFGFACAKGANVPLVGQECRKTVLHEEERRGWKCRNRK